MKLSGISGILALAGYATAVFRDDAGVIDAKNVYLGTPLAVSQHNTKIAVISDAHVLTVLTEEGSLSWRHILSDKQLKSKVALFHDLAVIGGDYISGVNATDGKQLWTIDYPSVDILQADNGILIDNKFIVTKDGQLKPTNEYVGNNYSIEGTKVSLPNGTLCWDKFGVVKYTDNEGNLKFTRDDGLAYAKQGIFVKSHRDVGTKREVDTYPAAGAITPDDTSFVVSTANRLASHIYQLYGLCRFIITKGPAMLVLPEMPKEQFDLDQTLVVLTKPGSVYGLNTTSGEINWVYHDLDAETLAKDHDDASRFYVQSSSGSTFLMTFDGDFIGTTHKIEGRPYDLLKISESIVASPSGWSVNLPGDKIVGSAIRNADDVTASVVVPIDNKGAVYYKYLNPFAAAFASYSSDSKQLVITILDTVTGRILSQNTHAEPVVINEEWPLQIVYGEHWVVYTYLSLDASQAPKIAVIELFESSKPNERVTQQTVNVHNDTTVPHSVSRSWIVPSRGQPVYSLGLSKSLFGASAREIILAFEHQVVSVPKYLLSTPAPATPVLVVPQSGHLSHIFGISSAQKIVTGSTNLESTYLVAAIGGPDLFFTMSSPSGEFDSLNKAFPKIKLIAFVGLLGFAVATMSPLARMKVLKQQWR